VSQDREDELFISFNGSASGGVLVFIFATPIVGEARYAKLPTSNESTQHKQ